MPAKTLMFMFMVGGIVAVVSVIVNGVIRYAQLRRREAVIDAASIRERLERIEIAVDTIAIEVERLGEHHRFNAQLAMGRPNPLPPKVVTPH
jgi:hypothetical protein